MVSPPAIVGFVGFVGLDELSLQLASALLNSGFVLQGFEDVESSAMDRFLKLGGAKCASPMDAAKDASTVVVVKSMEESNDILFGKQGVVKGLNKDAVVILRSALLPNDITKLQKSFTDEVGPVLLVDAYIFQGYFEGSKEKLLSLHLEVRRLCKRPTMFFLLSVKNFTFLKMKLVLQVKSKW
ncbi:uncharacterized protein M6B38_181885 [Iris pallida]|uniref:6-phosphogluconate dehydrogenase NADP-binding domain-containing protein n=1 Tax=Iris pallida TaxID=29817 RepID=A0AAX6EM31_IRIPA|nr:uncharacterized protein M6B38_181885 [Iris pallida]